MDFSARNFSLLKLTSSFGNHNILLLLRTVPLKSYLSLTTFKQPNIFSEGKNPCWAALYLDSYLFLFILLIFIILIYISNVHLTFFKLRCCL